MTGTTLSHYKIVSELGRGGMGIVYKAEDTKLDRTVAIKVLPASALSNEEDRARFYREAKAAAQLHHQHIASVFEIDEAVPEGGAVEEPRPFIAMEYIDGEPLDQHINKAPLQLEEAVRIASQVAGALEAAHEKNIVHRDIKSANVMLTSKGEPKVLDFGLAKTAASTKLTRMGSTMGTVAYMSPEQARGEEVDHRSDLWSLGVMMYEMISGQLPFSAEYEQAAVYGILNEDPEPLTSLRTGVPMDLEYIVNKLLTKEKKHRYQGAAEIVADLSAIKESTRSRTSTHSVNRASPGPSKAPATGRTSFTWIHGTILVAALALTWVVATQNKPSIGSQETSMHLSLELPEHLPLSFFGGSGLGVETGSFSVSRDGTRLVYVADSPDGIRLVTHVMGSSDFVVKDETGVATRPVFSPDGSQIAYFSDSQIFVLPFESGRPSPITSASDPQAIYWSDDNWIYWADLQGIVLKRVRPNGSSPAEVVEETVEYSNISEGLNDGDLLLSNGRNNELFNRSSDGALRMLSQAGSGALFAKNGLILSAKLGNLRAGTIRWADEDLNDDSEIFQTDIRTGSINGHAHFGLTDAGTLFYASGGTTGLTNVVIRNPDGRMDSLPFDSGFHGHMDATRDGERIVVKMLDGSDRILLYDLSSQTATLLLQQPQTEIPILNESGNAVTYRHIIESSSSIERLGINSAKNAEILMTSQNILLPFDWSSDGIFLLYVEHFEDRQILKVFDSRDSTIVTITEADGRVWSPKFSPDDALIAYTLIESQGSEVIVQPFPPTGERWSVSDGVGEEPEWRDDTNELIFRATDAWYSVAYSTDPVSFNRPQSIFQGPFVNIAGMEYRVLDKGRVLLQESIAKDRTTSRLEVITNWTELAWQTLADRE